MSIINILRRIKNGLKNRRMRSARLREWKAAAPDIDPEALTYYPGEPRKSKEEVLAELEARCSDALTYDGSVKPTVENYFMFGLDRKGVAPHSFVGDREYYPARNACQPPLAYLLTYKHVAALYLRARGVRVSCPVGCVGAGVLQLFEDSANRQFTDWLLENPGGYFLKPEADMCARNCFSLMAGNENGALRLLIDNAPATVEELLRKSEGCLVEPRLYQHAQLRKISPQAVFPIRIRTIRKGGGAPEFLSAYIAIGWKDSTMANICFGQAIGVALDAEGYGISDGLQEPDGKGGGGRRYTRHPETGDVFKGYHVPMMKEAIQLALKAHSTLPSLHSVGWDVAVLDDGPLIIEGNADYGVVTYQGITGIGERELFEKWYKPYALHSGIGRYR